MEGGRGEADPRRDSRYDSLLYRPPRPIAPHRVDVFVFKCEAGARAVERLLIHHDRL